MNNVNGLLSSNDEEIQIIAYALISKITSYYYEILPPYITSIFQVEFVIVYS